MDFFCSDFVMDRKEEAYVGWISRLKMSTMKSGLERGDWAGIQNVFSFPSMEARGRFGCVEKLDMAWESPVV